MFNGKMKAITFSYDDGVTQDRRLVEIFNKYGLKATFNINSELLGKSGSLNSLIIRGKVIDHNKIEPEEVGTLYVGHEVAVHTLTHPNLTKIEDDAEVIRQVEEDRKNLSRLAGYEVIGMAYPCGGVNSDERVAKLIRENTGVKYARNITERRDIEPYTDLYLYKPSYYHAPGIESDWQRFVKACRDFVEMTPDSPKVLYIWGHSYELDEVPGRWEEFEQLCAYLSGREDIFYGTNKEILLGE